MGYNTSYTIFVIYIIEFDNFNLRYEKLYLIYYNFILFSLSFS